MNKQVFFLNFSIVDRILSAAYTTKRANKQHPLSHHISYTNIADLPLLFIRLFCGMQRFSPAIRSRVGKSMCPDTKHNNAADLHYL